MDNYEVSVCVITYNSEQYISDLLESIKVSSLKPVKLLIIDNNSSDDTVSIIEKAEIDKSVIQLPENKGHSYAANLALKECGTRYLILMDHDTIVDKDLFLELYTAAKDDKNAAFAVFAPKIVDKSRNEVHYGGEFHYIGKTYTNRKSPEDPEVGMISSTAPLIDLERIPPDIYFDDDFFIYWNDADFFYRLRACGIKIKLIEKAVVYHLGGTKDYSHRGGTAYSYVRAFYVLRNHRLFIIKNYSISSIVVFLPCFLLYEFFNIIFCLKKRVFFKGYIYSIFGTLRLIPRIIRKRIIFQKMRKLGERDLVGSYGLDYNPGVVSTGFEKRSISVFEHFLGIYFSFVKKVFWKGT